MTPSQTRLLSLFQDRSASLLIDRADELNKHFIKLMAAYPDMKDYVANTQIFVMSELDQARRLCEDMVKKLKEGDTHD